MLISLLLTVSVLLTTHTLAQEPIENCTTPPTAPNRVRLDFIYETRNGTSINIGEGPFQIILRENTYGPNTGNLYAKGLRDIYLAYDLIESSILEEKKCHTKYEMRVIRPRLEAVDLRSGKTVGQQLFIQNGRDLSTFHPRSARFICKVLGFPTVDPQVRIRRAKDNETGILAINEYSKEIPDPRPDNHYWWHLLPAMESHGHILVNGDYRSLDLITSVSCETL